MPNKYAEKRGWKVPKQKYKVANWPEYNKALRQRGSIDVWLSNDVIDFWCEPDRVNDGTGSPKRGYAALPPNMCNLRLPYPPTHITWH